MHYNQSLDTAILLFIRDAQEEARLKLFHRQLSFAKRLKIVTTFNRHTTQVVRKSGIPFYTIAGKQQVGTNFGERFANAIESIFSIGYKNIIAIGNDCPSLTAHQLRQPAQLLSIQPSVVLGPAKDGGVYTIGISRIAYDRNTFINLPWQTAALLASFTPYCQKQQVNCCCLAQATDIDDELSFQEAFQQLSPHLPIYSILKNILQQFTFKPFIRLFFLQKHIISIPLLRAPPIYVALHL